MGAHLLGDAFVGPRSFQTTKSHRGGSPPRWLVYVLLPASRPSRAYLLRPMLLVAELGARV
jgi:hypothetical protein